MNSEGLSHSVSVGEQNYFFGQKLQELRKGRGLSQERLAQKLGVTRSTVANYETGRSLPPFWVVEKAAVYFNVGIDELSMKGGEQEQ